MSNVSLSVIIPALNEEKAVAQAITNCLKALDDFKIKGEIIAINDGSTDRTLAIMNECKDKDSRVTVLSNAKPGGFGGAFWQGVDASTMTACVVLPGDNENDPWEIFRYIELLEHVDLVIPFVFNKEVRSQFRRFLSFSYRVIINATFRTNLNYTNGTILYRVAALRTLEHRNTNFFFQTDILIRLIKNGYLFAEVPYRLEQREAGVSKAVSFPSFLKVAKGYLRLIKDQYQGVDMRPHASDSLTAQRNPKKESTPKLENH